MVEAARADEHEVNFIEPARVIWRHRVLIASLMAVSTLAAVAYGILTPRIYESTATVIVPREGNNNLLTGLAAMSGLLQQAPGLSAPSLTPNRDLLVGVLRSRTVAKAVTDRFGLQERYRARYLEDAIKKLQDKSAISLSREGVIAVKVEDTDPSIAADMANFFVDQLDRIVAQYGMGEGGRQRRFLTEQLARTKTDLESGEETLRRFQERNRAIVLQDQTKGAIEAAARLKGEIIASEVQLQVMKNFATEANPDVAALRRRVDEMTRQLGRMQYGDGATPQRESRDFAVPFARVPEVGLELVRLTREVKIQETLVMLLTQQLEQARIAEAKDIPVVQVLDRGVPAERPSKPRTALNLAIALVTSLLIGVSTAFIHDYTRNLRGMRR
jgi:capsule polysaccharide export protein KpsE/RkpR